ncbi:MAG TPA: tyrosine-type recombinase/integrase [Caldilinea sp.]|nr:tyrosine-type recombinase/integrase [Caldilinea sp.]
MRLEIAIEQLRDVVRRKHLAFSTEQNYAQWVTRFSWFVVDRCSPALLPAQKMELFLTQLARQDVSASTQNQAFCALLFFYREVLKVDVGKVDSLRAKKPVHLRYAPELGEVKQLLDRVKDTGGYPTRLIVKLIYGCGLRVSEPLNLRVKDVLLSESKLVIRAAKGGKDRFVSLPCCLSEAVRAQLAYAKSVAEQDRLNGLPVALPGLLARKYPHWQFSPKWAFLFPARTPCAHPRSGVMVRWRCLEVNVQRCVRTAARPLGLDITPHHLRHAYATHCLNGGQNPRAIQQAMGHSQLETTMGYLHAEALSVRSPMELMTP